MFFISCKYVCNYIVVLLSWVIIKNNRVLVFGKILRCVIDVKIILMLIEKLCILKFDDWLI